MDVLLEAGTANPSRALAFAPGFLVWSVLLIFLVFCVMFSFVYGLFILDCPFVYGLFILDFPFVFGLSILQFSLSFIHIGPFIIPIYALWLIWVDELYLIDEEKAIINLLIIYFRKRYL